MNISHMGNALTKTFKSVGQRISKDAKEFNLVSGGLLVTTASAGMIAGKGNASGGPKGGKNG